MKIETPSFGDADAVYLCMSKNEAKLLYFVVLQQAQLPLMAMSDDVIRLVRGFQDELAKALR